MKRWISASLAGLALCALLVSLSAAQSRSVVVPADKALLIIRVPTADTAVKIGEFASNQRGHERLFYTPMLAPGFSYSYQVEATWIESGKSTKTVRQANFKAGETLTLDFTVAEPAEKTAKPVDIAKKLPVGVERKDDEKKSSAKERSFLFTYAGMLKDIPPGKEARVWLPVAVSGPEQVAKIVTQNLPAQGKIYKEKQYGNTMLYFVAKANDKGEIPFEVVYKVQRKEVKTDSAANLTVKPAPKENLSRFLEPDAKVPITGKPLELLKDKKVPNDQFAAARVFYDVVNNHMKYSKEGKGWGQGDSVWACDSKFGNCSDFHSLFISMARGNKIPSKFEMGFPLPTKHGKGVIGGYHCWAWFLPNQQGWIPVDISEANRNPELKEYYFGNLTEDRVRFTTGRDINLEPRQKGSALNFFIYPYAEVDGKVHPQEKIERRFAYKDVN
jgi:uncharacterized protein (TIGR03000 family)